jgi:hypothetical protein
MARRRQYRAESHEVDTYRGSMRQFAFIMAGSTNPLVCAERS